MSENPETEATTEQAAEKPTTRRRGSRRATAPAAAPEHTAADAAASSPAGDTDDDVAATGEVPDLSADLAALSESKTSAPTARSRSRRATGTKRASAPAATPAAADAGSDADGAEKVEDKETGAPASRRSAPAARRASRRATAPTREPDQALDVLAALGAGDISGSGAADDGDDETPDEAATDGATTNETTDATRADDAQATDADATDQDDADEDEDAIEEASDDDSSPRLPASALLFQAPDLASSRPRRRAVAAAGSPELRFGAPAASDDDAPATDRSDARSASTDSDPDDAEETPQRGGRSGGGNRSGRSRRARTGSPSAPQGSGAEADDTKDSGSADPDNDGSDGSGTSGSGSRGSGSRGSGRNGSRAKNADDDASTDADASDDTDSDDSGSDDESGEGQGGGRKRRRRGGRGRRNRSGQRSDDGDGSNDNDGSDDGDDAASGDRPGSDRSDDSSSDDNGSHDDNGNGDDSGDDQGSSRRRRRRRRGGGNGPEVDDGAARARDEVTALKGSTRLEAKRQRRREGRDAGRRRTTISESEFLARRESVERRMLVRERDGLNQIAVLEDGVLVEHYVARHTQTSMVGNVYLGRVQNVLPSMEAAFVDIGKGRNAVLYAGEVNWAAAGMSGQPRKIEQALKSGDHVLVQVTKDPIGHKGARLTSQITLAGRHLVFVPSGSMTGISRKLPESERSRLKNILKEIVPSGSGVIVRTAAEGASEQQLKDDVDRLTKIWADIEKKSGSGAKAPVLLKGEPELAVRVVRDVFNEDFRSLTVQGDTAWTTINGYVTDLAPDLADRVEHWTEPGDLFAAHRVDEQLAKGMDRKVWLPSGGSLVIDRTEAMTVVDVNTGKFTGSGGTLEETVTKNNLEAAEEIVRQLRLRDIGGIIVIDFIDMVLPQNRDLVVRRLLECLGRDRTRHQVAEVTSLGLVQMTRKRVGQGLVEAFSTPCEHCHGRGFIVHDHPIERSDAAEAQIADSSEQGGRRRRGRGASSRGGNGSGAGGNGGSGSGSGSSNGNGKGGEQGGEAKPEPDREAVRQTLAQIAAAAANAHDRDGSEPSPAEADEKAEDAAGSGVGTTEAVTSGGDAEKKAADP
ncbi:MAG: Rne/Rng family ribonuclease, partial [Actinomycetaceae bacterium]